MIELLMVIAIIAILMAMLLPSLFRTKQKAQGIYCMNNHRQLTLAWRLYADDNNDFIVFASEDPWNPSTYSRAWTTSHMDFDPNNRANWDVSYDIARGPLWPYTGKNASIYKCPSDRSFVVVNGEAKPRVRTMSMNLFLGGFGGEIFWPQSRPHRVFQKMAEVNAPGAPGAAKTFVFLDMREDRINWGNFMTDMTGFAPRDPAQYRFVEDLPGMYHNNACGFSFADGHSEIKRWLDPRTTPPLMKNLSVVVDSASPHNPDIAWLQEHTTRPK